MHMPISWVRLYVGIRVKLLDHYYLCGCKIDASSFFFIYLQNLLKKDIQSEPIVVPW